MGNPQYIVWRRINNYKKLHRRAVKMIKKPTEAEALLWQSLQTLNMELPEGFYFQRQFVVTPYILDFYCKQAKVCIEVDGMVHLGSVEDDAKRDSFLRRVKDIRTFRVTNEAVYDFQHRQAFINLIKNSCGVGKNETK